MNTKTIVTFLNKNSFLLYSIVFIISFVLGLTNINLRSRDISLDNVSFSNDSFFKILLNNFLLGVSLLLGFIFFNIYNVIIIFFNGLFWGFYLNKFFSNLGLLNSIILFIPHAILEYYWIISISVYSTKLSFDFYKFLNSGFDDNSLFKNLVSIYTLKLLSLILLSAIVESYVTGSLFNLLNTR